MHPRQVGSGIKHAKPSKTWIISAGPKDEAETGRRLKCYFFASQHSKTKTQFKSKVSDPGRTSKAEKQLAVQFIPIALVTHIRPKKR
ncbi:hypothetical protein Nepgr_009308 [Nepenthes gracilis]|uniref:Uncharacterized protein n=1 Tax=Nepenthes gracilis TaxID=150966 RepID=A0AAD3XK14_NEPGR|nr:hypothetical protein Nepgr_009308 [Nepenthes gracilis]